MTELPRYIGRHASPEAAAPPSDETTPEDHPAIPRLDFDPGSSDETTTVLDDTGVPDWTPSMPPRSDRWGGPPRDETPPPGPEPPLPDLGPSGTGRLPGSPGRPIRPDSWSMRPGRSSTPLADAVASKPPTPPAPPAPPASPFPPAPTPPSAPQASPVVPPPVSPPPAPPGADATTGPDAEPWTSQAPDIPAGPVPVPEPIVEAVAAPELAPELPDESEPEPEAVEAPEAVESDAVAVEPEPDGEEIDAGNEPTIETLADLASAEFEPEPESDVAPNPAPEVETDPEPETSTEPEPTTDPETNRQPEANTEPEPETDPEPDPETHAEFDRAPDPEPEPTSLAGPPSSPAPFNAWRDEPMLTPAPGPIRRSPVRREIDSHGLARLALLDAIDETWPGGTPDLSAWLAGNLDLLEDPLGFSLETRQPVPMTPERQVSGSFDPEGSPLDFPGNIVTADGSGASVMVRAQVGAADPEGLGALLAAAAASQARTAVWVCPRIDDGFRQALRWVGGDPSANVRLYGLEMYLVRINDSSTAPLFDAVVAPGAP